MTGFRILAVVLALSLSGCGLLGGSKKSDDPTGPVEGPTEAPSRLATVELTGNGSMNAGGNAARVYLYPLTSDATFLSTPVQVFWDDPAATLGSDLVGTARDATVRPGDTTTLTDLALGEAAFLGIAADLRTPVGTSWRTVLRASDVRGKTVSVTVTEGGLRVSSE